MVLLNEIIQFSPQLLKGTWITIQLTVLSIALSVVIALVFGIMRHSRVRVVNLIALVYIDFFRGSSALVILYWIYFALPFLGITLQPMTAGVVGLGATFGAYGADFVRGSIEAIPREQYMAATALNFTRWQTTTRIILPQAVIRMVPPFGNLFIQLLKGTALVSLITIHDLTFQAQILRSQTYKTVVLFSMTLVMYFILASLITAGMRALERKLSFGRDYGGVQL
ncbi:MAG TPA: ectoine/hydroxyectoine ABC transporter permease subunit EhuC [Spirochaetia bacterium]|nr:ectoine/hydroxyectoine ABC transporter permease subunit EhuC [Spirochaetia bacterium]